MVPKLKVEKKEQEILIKEETMQVKQSKHIDKILRQSKD